jgi:hypothetical protein
MMAVMRIILYCCLAIVLASCAKGTATKQRAKGSERDGTPSAAKSSDDLVNALRGIEPRIRQTMLLLTIDAGDSKLLLVHGSVDPIEVHYTNGEFPWGWPDVVAVLRQQGTGGKLETLDGLQARYQNGGCCYVRILRATPDEIVLSRTGEKSYVGPDLKFFVDSKSPKATRIEFAPFTIQAVQIPAGAPYFVAGDKKQFRVIRATSQPPFLELLSEQAASPIVSGLDVESSSLPGEEFRRVKKFSKEIRFGPGDRFRAIVDQGENKITEETASDPKEYLLPQSTSKDWASARPEAAANISPPEAVTISEAIGPAQVIGSRLWFGKTFYDGEGNTGVGGIGYFDAATRTFKLVSVPEMRDASVSALKVEGDIVWAGLDSAGEYGAVGLGLVRIDLRTMQTEKFNLPSVVSEIVRYGDRVYLATSDGVTIIFPDGRMTSYFIDVSRDGPFQLSEIRESR